jgi:hypothetical protein
MGIVYRLGRRSLHKKIDLQRVRQPSSFVLRRYSHTGRENLQTHVPHIHIDIEAHVRTTVMRAET